MAFGAGLAPLRHPRRVRRVGLGCAPIGDLFPSVNEADADATVVRRWPASDSSTPPRITAPG